MLRLPSCTWRNPALDPSTPGLIGVSVEDTLAKISDLADAAEPVAYPEEFNIDTDESSSGEVETVETLASADGTGDGDAGDAGDDDPADPETEVKVGTSNWRVQLLCGFFGYKSVPSTVYQV